MAESNVNVVLTGEWGALLKYPACLGPKLVERKFVTSKLGGSPKKVKVGGLFHVVRDIMLGGVISLKSK